MTTEPYRGPTDRLWDELTRVEHLVRARVAVWNRLMTDGDKPHEHWGLLHVSPGEVDAYLAAGFSAPDRRMAQLDALIAPHRDAHDRAAEAIRERMEATADADGQRLSHLVRALRLEQVDVDLLLLTVLPEVDHRYGLVYGYLQNDASRSLPTVDVLTQVLAPVHHEPVLVRGHLAAGGALRRGQLVRVEAAAVTSPGRRSVAVDERVLRYLLGDDTGGEGVLRHVRSLPRARTDGYVAGGERRAQLQALADWAAQRAGDGGAVVLVHGPPGSGRRTTAGLIAAAAGLPLLAVDAAAVLAESSSWRPAVDLVYREALLRRAAVLWTGMDVLVENGVPSPAFDEVMAAARSHTGLSFLATADRVEPVGTAVPESFARVSCPPPDHATRIGLWRRYLPDDEAFADPPPDREWLARTLANAFQLTPGQIVGAVASAQGTARVRDAVDGRLHMDDLAEGCRFQSSRALTRMARRVEPRPGLGFDELTLPEANRRQLHELRRRIALRGAAADADAARNRARVRGLLVMFTGSSGTGKTMAAELLAHEQGVDLFAVDLAEVVSKYIGETEKNLRRVFEDAEDANAIIFFDEADALFGKRGEVREARDRWANIEVNFLLQRIELFTGVVILATNLRQNIDEAFLRRIHMVVEFPFPGVEDRLRIWEGMLPPPDRMGRPDHEVLEELVRRFPLPGGSIRNIVTDAMFRALDAGGDPPMITSRHIAASVAREYQKLGRPLTPVEFGTPFYRWIAEDVLIQPARGGDG